jgi:hypothetical protein
MNEAVRVRNLLITRIFPKLAPFLAGEPLNALEGGNFWLRSYREFLWDVVDLGGIESSRYLEPMCMAWVVYGVRTGTWNHAFRLLR